MLDIWWEPGVAPLEEPGLVEALAEALDAHCWFGGATRIALPRTVRHRALVGALRALRAASVAR